MTQDILPPTVVEALDSGNKIEAIKRLRNITGLGLKEAKDWVDSYERGEAPPLSEFAKSAGRDPNAAFTLPPAAIEALKRGSPIEAIKIIRDSSGAGLAEAKSIVDEIVRNIQAKARSSGHSPASHASHHARSGLGPGEVPRGGGAGKWLALIAIAAILIAVALYY